MLLLSIQSEITRISGNVTAALEAIAGKGVIVPVGSTSDDLADLIALIEGGGGEPTSMQVYIEQDEDGYLMLTDTALIPTAVGVYF